MSDLLPEAASRVAELATDVGIRSRAPTALIGAATQRDAFSYGLRHGRRIALPPAVAVRWRDAGLFDNLMRHEFAHHLRGDVAWAWFARASLYGLLPLLLLPIVFVIGNEGEVVYLRDYFWRVILLGVVTLLVSRALLRSREHEADLLAAGLAHDVAGTESLIRRLVTSPRQPGWRSLLAYHPAASHRLDVLAAPERAAQVSFLDAFVAALLAALSTPLLIQLFEGLLLGAQDSSSKALVATVAIAGLLLGFSVGTGLARAALALRVVGGNLKVLPPALGVAAGLVAGQAASLGQTANGTFVGLQHPWLLVISAWTGLAAVAVAGGVAHLLARAAGRLGSASMVRSVATITNSVLFATAIWFAFSFQGFADNLPTQIVALWFVLILPSWVLTVSATLWILVVLFLMRQTRVSGPPPRWSMESDFIAGEGDADSEPPKAGGALAIGLACGILASLTIVTFRLIAGAPVSADAALDHSLLILLTVAAAGVGVAVGTWATDPQAGYATGAAGAFVASMVCLTTLLGIQVVTGGSLIDGLNVLMPQVLTFGLGAAVGVAPGLSAIPNSRRLRRLVAAVAVSLMVTLVLAAAVISLRDPISNLLTP